MSYEYIVVGAYRGGEFEELDTAESREVAEYLVKEYRVAFGNDWEVELAN